MYSYQKVSNIKTNEKIFKMTKKNKEKLIFKIK